MRSLAIESRSICRTRSREMPKTRPISSRVCGLPVVEAVAHPHDDLLALVQGVQHPDDVVVHEAGDHHGLGGRRLGVLDEVTQRGLLVGADRHVQGDRVAGVVQQVGDPLLGDPRFLGQLGDGGVAAELLVQLPLEPGQLVDLLDQVDGQPDGAALVGHAAGDRLPDPPGRVGGELETLGVVELLDRADQPEVALLDQVQQRHAAAGVALGQRDDQPQVGHQQVAAGPVAVPDDGAQVGPLLRGQIACRSRACARRRGRPRCAWPARPPARR